MITVRFFGLTRLRIKVSSIQLEATTIDELLHKISEEFSNTGIVVKELKQSVIFVNGTNIQHLKLFKTKLNVGDEVQILSPAGGG